MQRFFKVHTKRDPYPYRIKFFFMHDPTKALNLSADFGGIIVDHISTDAKRRIAG